MAKRKSDRQRKAQVHTQQMSLLGLSADPRLLLQKRMEILKDLRPKYFLKAIDETLSLQFCGNNSKLLETKENVKIGKWSVQQALENLGVKDV